MFKHNRLLSVLAFALLLIGAVRVVSVAGAFPLSATDTPEPLPNACQEVTEAGEDPPACCAFGYVYYGGVPVSSAQVTIEGPSGSFSTTTSTGPAATDAYYRVNLSASPLGVSSGDAITVTATYSGSSASTVYQVVGDGQQVDVVIPMAGGSQPPIGTINYIYPNPAQQGSATVAFAGSGVDGDEDGATIVAWEWASDLDGVLSTKEDFLQAASSLSAGTHSISFRVQDDEGNWSGTVVRTLLVEASDTPVCGPIFSDTTWTLAGSPYIVTCSVLVMEGVTLTIEPGVEVKFNAGVALQIDGELIAQGTSGSLITFTSNVGTSPGDWGYILFTDTSVDAVYDAGGNYVSGSIIQYAIIEYGGGASISDNGALRIDASSPSVDHTTVRDSASNGICAFNNGAPKMTYNTISDNAGRGISVSSNGTIEVSHNTISNNGGGVSISYMGCCATATISYNTITNNNGGISLWNVNASIFNNYVRDNTGQSGIAIIGGDVTITSNVITGNKYNAGCAGDGWGGGINICGGSCNGWGGGTVTVINNTIMNNKALTCWSKGGGINNSGGTATIRNNIIAHNTAQTSGGGIASGGYYGGDAMISGNVIVNNTALGDSGGGVSASAGTISYNVIASNSAPSSGGINSNGTVNNNSIIRNTAGNNAAVGYDGDGDFSSNTILDNVSTGGGILRAVYIRGHPTFNSNNIYGNTGYALYNGNAQGSANLNATNNWWGTTNDADIQALIYDWFDDSNLGIVDYIPYLTEHSTAAPISPPTGLAATPSGTSITLNWSPNPESDLAGYKVYYDTNYGFPYDGTGANEGDSPIDVGNVTSFTLTGLTPGTRYHIAVTAYDTAADGATDQTEGHESWYSDEVSAIPGGPQPSLSIDDVTVVEGDAGTVDAVFTVTLSAVSDQQVTVDYASADGTATGGSDYVAVSGTLTFPAGTTTQNVTVVVNGDTLDEPDETFFVNLSNPTNATIADGQGVGTITDDDGEPSLSIDDVTVVEGDSGTVDAVFTVSLSAPSGQQVTVDFATADGTAKADSDYVATNGTLTFPAGTTTQNVTVEVIGDTLDEGSHETFFVNLSNPSNATIADGQGVGTITDDDGVPSLSIDDVTVVEGDAGTVDAVFTVTLSAVSDQQVTVDYASADGTATGGSDYVAVSGTLTFPAGTTTQNVTVEVIGDTLYEQPDEIFYVNLSNATNADIGKGQGVGTIDDDDPPPGGPDITVTPTSVNVTLAEGQSTTVPLKIGNVGDATLTFTITEESTTAAVLLVARHLAFPPDKVDPALLDSLEAAPDGRATFFVYLEEQADLSAAYAIQDWKARGEYVYHALRETAQRSQKDLLADLRRQQSTGAITEYRPFFILNAVAVTGGRSAVDALAARSDVTYLSLEPVFQIPEPLEEKEASATSAGVEWNISKIGADRVWADFGVTGAGVVVANIDSGVDHTHLALVNQYRATTTGSHDYNWYDPTGKYPNAPGDNTGHGTHVMGTMVGDDGAGNQIGVAPGGQWIAAKGCASSSCSGSDLLAAAQWMLAPCPIGVEPGEPACDASRRPRVVNNSWGGWGGDPWFLPAVQSWRAADIFPAFSAGNSGPGEGTVGSPGDYAQSFASGATDSGDVIAHFSSRGPSSLTPETKPDVAAPGRRVRSSLPGGGYRTYSGTSMASPHTAGAVALILDANSSLSVSQVESLLMSTAKDLGKSGADYTYGYGRIDVYTAVANANDPVPWLSEDPASGSVSPGGEQIVTVTLNAAGLDVRTYTANLIITSNDLDESPLTVPVTLTVTSPKAQISGVTVSNLRDVSASVSWITSLPADGQVYYGTDTGSLTNVAYDDRGAATSDDVHHVTLSGLSLNTTYYFYVLSDGVADTNNGSYYSFTTGTTLGVPSSDSVYGQVFKSDGVTPASDVLVYLRVLNNDDSGSLDESGLLSALTDDSGFWYDVNTGGALNLASARTKDGSAYFSYSASGDAVRVRVVGGGDCDGLVQLDTGNDSPAPPITLSCVAMMDLDISTGWDVFVLPVPPAEDYSAEGLLDEIRSQGGDALEMDRWLAEFGNWSSHLRDLPFGDFDLEPGRPYFLRATNRSLLRLQPGVGIDQSDVITLTTGWNFVALPRLAEPLTSEEACTQIAEQGGAVSEIDRWDAETGNWAGHICGLPFGDFTMTPDEGHFIKSQADSTWRPEGGSTAATPESSPITSEPSRLGKLVSKGREILETLTAFARRSLGLSDSPIIHYVRISNVGDRSFTVSWLTDRPAPGYVRFGTDSDLINVAYDDRGTGVVSQSHHVTLKGLAPDTAYYAALVSGDATDDNDGAFYQVVTGPTLSIPAVYRPYGRVFRADGVTPAAGALVYVTVADDDGQGTEGQASLLSAITDEDGYWSLNLGVARTQDSSAYFVYSDGDRMTLEAWQSLISQASQVTTVGEASPAPTIILGKGWKVYLPLVMEW